MEKYEIFKKAIEKGKFEGCKEGLLSIGLTIGSNRTAFKELYTAYFTNESKYEHQPRRGPKIEFEFSRSRDVLIKRSELELKFSTARFLEYMSLQVFCYGDIYPLGSVVELDEMLFTKKFMRSSGVLKENGRILAVITGRFVPVDEGNKKHVIEYVATPFPSGKAPSGEKVTMFLNKVLIKNLVHSGYSDEKESEYVQELREELVLSNKKSVAFLTDAEMEDLASQKGVQTQKEVRVNRELIDGEVS